MGPKLNGSKADDGRPEYEFIGVTKAFGVDRRPFIAVQQIDLAVQPGEFVALVGPSGCGKSTLLNLAAGLSRPSLGEVRYRGVPIRGINTEVGYMTQHDDLLPWRSLEKNVAIALEIQQLPRRQRRDRVAAVLAEVGLAGFEKRFPSELSGGMRKRASLARLLAYGPSTLLMDEPFGALDAQRRLALQRQLLEIWERDKKTVLFVTHDLEEAVYLADRVVVFGSRPGRVIHVEEVNLPRPRDLFALRGHPDFIGMVERLWTLLEPQFDDEAAPGEVAR